MSSQWAMLSHQHLLYRCNCSINIVIVRPPIADRNAQTLPPLPNCPDEKRFTSALNRGNDLIGMVIVIVLSCPKRMITKAHQALIDLWLSHNVYSIQRAKSPDQDLGEATGPFNQGSKAMMAQMTDGRIGTFNSIHTGECCDCHSWASQAQVRNAIFVFIGI